MSNNKKNDRNEARHLMLSGMAMITVSLLLGVFLVMMGCSGGHTKSPTDPVGSKPADSDTSTDRGTIGGVNDGQIPDDGMFRESALDPEYEWAVPQLLELWETGQDGQTGDNPSLDPVVCGVFDSETKEPITGAFVSLGLDGTFVGETGLEGLVGIPDYIHETGNPEEAMGAYITAGAAGYEMESYNNLETDICVFFLDPLVPTPKATATVSGTIDFQTTDFYADVYVSNLVNNVDATLTPSGPSDEDDTYEIDVEAGTTGYVFIVKRNSESGAIEHYCFTEIFSLGEGQTFLFEGNFPETDRTESFEETPRPEPTTETELNWHKYANPSQPVHCALRLVDGSSENIASLSASMQYFGEYNNGIVINDLQTWSTKPGVEDTFRLLTTSIPSIYPLSFPYYGILTKINVEYDDGSGTSTIGGLHMVNTPYVSSELKLIPPPTIEFPADGTIDIGITPDFEWLFYYSEENSDAVMTLIDTVNGNRWKFHLTTYSTATTTLPTLPTEMEGFGLTLNNSVQAMIELDIESNEIFSYEGTTTTTSFDDLMNPESYSKVYTFTP